MTFKKQVLLFVLHNIVGREPFGGVEVYEDIITQQLRTKFDILRLIPTQLGPVGYELLDADASLVERFAISAMVSSNDLRHVELESIFSTIVRRYDVSIVHFHHFMFFVPSLPLLARALGVRTVWTAHDYHAACRNYNLTNRAGASCLSHYSDVKACDRCLYNDYNEPFNTQRLRRNAFSSALLHIDAMVFPSKSALDLLTQIFPLEIKRATSLVLAQPTKPQNIPAKAPPVDVLAVAIVGNFSLNKGAQMCLEIFDNCCGEEISFHVFGRVDEPFLSLLQSGKFPNVTLHGQFSSGCLPAAVGDCEVSLHLSNWPETFCMTLSEAWSLGLVPIVSDIGALGERVADGVDGFKVPISDSARATGVLRALVSSPEKLVTIRKNVSKLNLMNAAVHCATLDKLYVSLLPQNVGDLAFKGLELIPFNKVATLRSTGWNFLPDSIMPPKPTVFAQLVGAMPIGSRQIDRLVRALRERGIRFVVGRIFRLVLYRR